MTLIGESQGNIEGSCDQSGREGMILCQAFKHDITIPRDPQTGQPAGMRVHNPMIVTKYFDKSSPKLYQALTSGERMTDVTLKWFRIDNTGVEEHFFTIKLEEAIIVSMKPYVPNCLDPDFESFGNMEEVECTYRKIIWTWEPDGVESEDDWRVRKS
jgi:type VI secretion system secreted protein Hcp